MKSKTQLFIFALILSASIQVSVGEAEAEANPEANADAEPVPEAAPEGRPKLVVPGSDDELIIDEDAIILVNPIQKNTENRAPRQYRGQLATQQQRSASGASQTAKDLVSGESMLYFIKFYFHENRLSHCNILYFFFRKNLFNKYFTSIIFLIKM